MKAAALRAQLESELGGRWPSPFTFRERPAAETVSSGIAQIDSLTGAGGLPRGALTEIFGPDSSGRTSLMLSLLAQMTWREEVCALVDSSDAFDPQSAEAAGVDLKRLLWVRCGNSYESPAFTPMTDGLSQGRLKARNQPGRKHS